MAPPRQQDPRRSSSAVGDRPPSSTSAPPLAPPRQQDPRRSSSAVGDRPPSSSVAETIRQVADETTDGIRKATRALRSANRAVRSAARSAREMALLAAGVYTLGSALLDLCPWCKKGLRKLLKTPFCPNCHRDTLAWSDEMQQEFESQRKNIRASNKIEREDKEMELIQKIRETAMINKIRSRNRE